MTSQLILRPSGGLLWPPKSSRAIWSSLELSGPFYNHLGPIYVYKIRSHLAKQEFLGVILSHPKSSRVIWSHLVSSRVI